MKLRIVTFNIENLFSRFDFKAFTDKRVRRYLPPAVNFFSQFDTGDFSQFDDFKSLLQAAMISQDDDKRQHTSLALAEADADIVCLQEIDSIGALLRFRDLYLNKISERRYDQIILHEGNDFRGIDVAAMTSKNFPLLSRSHASMRVSDLGNANDRKS